ncbi:SO2930 family diheme c-type cytochrome [Lentisalinibacter salinarum]|uniref:SO2930 family diheme c-type cytochrome n=1 Tax=Lentisalinibacter salinarum TaxID=2992239 RepID=UPI00386E4B90
MNPARAVAAGVAARATAMAMAVLALAAGCGERQAPVFHETPPERLSEWGLVLAEGGRLVTNERVLPYTLNTPLFSDYAQKLRTVWMPEGRSARYRETGDWDFPMGTVLTKTFYYPVAGPGVVYAEAGGHLFDGAALTLDAVRLVETRLLVKQADGWEAYPYVWNEAQTEATLRPVGAMLALRLVAADGRERPFTYVVPDANQCGGCHRPDHTSKELRPLGPKTRHLNSVGADGAGGPGGPGGNQLAAWTEAGYLTGAPSGAEAPRLARWDASDGGDVAVRARAYLDVNCGHCHNPRGAADTSGLFLDIDTADPRRLGRCKPPVAAGRGSGNRRYSIVPGDPDASILVYRMETGDPAAAMPELGRALVHEEGVALIREWIAGMRGKCRT